MSLSPQTMAHFTMTRDRVNRDLVRCYFCTHNLAKARFAGAIRITEHAVLNYRGGK
jgi:hypothetical protein